MKKLLLLPALIVTGCATSGIAPVNPKVVAKMQTIDTNTLATMVIYRPDNALGSALHPTVMLDGKDLVNIGNSIVFVAGIPPGHYVFEMDDKKSGTELDLRIGQELYMKVEIVPGFWKGGGKLTQMAPEQGKYEATRLDLIPAREIEDVRFRSWGESAERLPARNPRDR